MRLKVTIEVFSDGGKELSKETVEIAKISNELELGAKTEVDVLRLRGVNQVIERSVLQAKIQEEPKGCECGSKRYKSNGSDGRVIKGINGEIEVRVGKIYCYGCGGYRTVGNKKLPPEGNISQELERLILELVPMTISYEGLSEVLYKLRGIKISPKEIERIVKERGKQIRDLQRDDYEQIDERLKEEKPKGKKRLYISSDGTYVHSVEGDKQKMEGKFGVVFSDEMAKVSRGHNMLMEKRYCSTFYGKEEFGEMLNATAYRMGLEQSKEVIYLCDGEKSLWDIKGKYFGEAKGILDWNHVSRNLHKSLVVMEDNEKRKAKSQEIGDLLYTGEVVKALEKIEKLIRRLQKQEGVSEKRLEKLKEFKGYIKNNQDYIIDYGKAKEEGYFISSSVMEATVNLIGANRLKKKRGRQWTRLGADGVTRVIGCIKNNEWNKVWNEIYTKNFHQN